jgi:hypothetical protein
MNETKIIRLVAQKIYPEVKAFSSEVEVAWNKDYSERHMPLSIKAKGLSKVTRYQLIPKLKGLPEHNYGYIKDYAKYLSIYKFGSMKDLEEYDKSPEHHDNILAHDLDHWLDKGIKENWLVEYEFMQAWEKTGAKDAKIIRLVAKKVDKKVKGWTPDVEAAWSKDYNERHMPLSIKAKGLSKVTRYQLMPQRKGLPEHQYGEEKGDYPKYLSIYEYESDKDLKEYDNSPEHNENIHQYFVDQWKEKGIWNKWLIEYGFMQSWEK